MPRRLSGELRRERGTSFQRIRGAGRRAEKWQGHRVASFLPAQIWTFGASAAARFPMRNGEGAIIGAAECFDETLDIAGWDRRHSKLAEYGCLDAASGVLNHKMVESRLRECLATFSEHPVPFCVMCIAFDHLEDVKARYGAGAIAAVLRIAGQSLENSLRPTDFLGRWQENEFLAILAECNRDEVPRVGERLRRIIQTAKITWWGDSLPLTISIGASAVKAEDSVREVVRRAQGALRESISQGGNHIVVWND